MGKLQMETVADEAIKFLVSRVEQQAHTDSVELTRNELNQLSFSEETASPYEISAAAEFDSSNDTAAFERKVVKLLSRAYTDDKRKERAAIWHKHLSALADIDVYVLVMVDEARIPRPKPKLRTVLVPKSAHGFRNMLLMAVSGILPLAGLFYFIMLPMRWGKRPQDPYIFGSLSQRLQVSDGVKAVLFVLWLASLFLIWRVTNKREHDS